MRALSDFLHATCRCALLGLWLHDNFFGCFAWHLSASPPPLLSVPPPPWPWNPGHCGCPASLETPAASAAGAAALDDKRRALPGRRHQSGIAPPAGRTLDCSRKKLSVLRAESLSQNGYRNAFRNHIPNTYGFRASSIEHPVCGLATSASLRVMKMSLRSSGNRRP